MDWVFECVHNASSGRVEVFQSANVENINKRFKSVSLNKEVAIDSQHMRSFVKMIPLRNGKITLSFIDIGKSCLSRKFFTSLI